jgi:hypothetical protein
MANHESANRLKRYILDVLDRSILLSEMQKEVLRGKFQVKSSDAIRSPKKPELKIAGTGETALQRAIFAGQSSTLKWSNGQEDTITWLDFELPVVPGGSARGRCIDLVGNYKGIPTIAELKFAKEGTPPEFAVLQVLIYYYHIMVYSKLLSTHHHKGDSFVPFDWTTICGSSNTLLVLANESYWDYWKKRKNWEACESAIGEMNVHLSRDFSFSVRLFSVSVELETFERQQEKCQSERYMPILPQESFLWTQVI